MGLVRWFRRFWAGQRARLVGWFGERIVQFGLWAFNVDRNYRQWRNLILELEDGDDDAGRSCGFVGLWGVCGGDEAVGWSDLCGGAG